MYQYVKLYNSQAFFFYFVNTFANFRTLERESFIAYENIYDIVLF